MPVSHKNTLRLNMKKYADVSNCGRYRYSLKRIWDEDKPLVAFIGLNPSTADAIEDDNTITRCINFAKSWGAGGLYMLNIFAYRATSPVDMMEQEEPIGPENDYYLTHLPDIEKVIVCWGNNGAHRGRSSEVISILRETLKKDLFCLDVNKTGEPKHPLYVQGLAKPKLYKY